MDCVVERGDGRSPMVRLVLKQELRQMQGQPYSALLVQLPMQADICHWGRLGQQKMGLSQIPFDLRNSYRH